jgi:hypothetical protein
MAGYQERGFAGYSSMAAALGTWVLSEMKETARREVGQRVSSYQSSGGKDNPQMFSGWTSPIPQIRGRSGSM